MKSTIDAIFDEMMNDILKAALRSAPCKHECKSSDHNDLEEKVKTLEHRVKALEDGKTFDNGWMKIKIDSEDIVKDDSASPGEPEEKATRRSNAINFGAEDIALRNVCINKIRIDIGEDRYLNMDLDAARMLYHALSVGLRKQKKAEKDEANEE